MWSILHASLRIYPIVDSSIEYMRRNGLTVCTENQVERSGAPIRRMNPHLTLIKSGETWLVREYTRIGYGLEAVGKSIAPLEYRPDSGRTVGFHASPGGSLRAECPTLSTRSAMLSGTDLRFKLFNHCNQTSRRRHRLVVQRKRCPQAQEETRTCRPHRSHRALSHRPRSSSCRRSLWMAVEYSRTFAATSVIP